MKQVLLTNDGVTVARMPSPTVSPGCVLVDVKYSMISVGTELAGLRKAEDTQDSAGYAANAGRYLGRAIQNPRHAAGKLRELIRRGVNEFTHAKAAAAALPDIPIENLVVHKDNAQSMEYSDGALSLLTDDSDWQYQAHTDHVEVTDGYALAVDIEGLVDDGAVSIGVLDESGSKWLGSSVLRSAKLDDRLVFNVPGGGKVSVVVSNAQQGPTRCEFKHFSVSLVGPDPDGMPHNEMGDTGWNLGYSVSGVVVAVGNGVDHVSVGDRVACGGAGKANHADFVSVPKNLVCRVPEGCDLQGAATTTVGTIAIQGVRRSSIELGEIVCVLGLGLIGQMIVQMAQAAGAIVVGLDLNERRVSRAMELGMEYGESNPDEFGQLIRDLTGNNGADCTIVAAATKSDIVINDAMKLTRRKGRVVIVGDVGLGLARDEFYKKELDLIMSTSYGPGRYDRKYEEGGIDYPYAYVRWTQNRNMQSYMDLIGRGKLKINELIERVEQIENAADLYDDLVNAGDSMPLGVLLAYGHEDQPKPADPKVVLRGHRAAHEGLVNYVLVGAGAYGQSMLVPNLDKWRDQVFLKGVVSRDSVRGGNFVRERRLEVFASHLDEVLEDKDVHMLVIATRHAEHAGQALQGLSAGKHVFVEKPLATTWEQLDQVVRFCEEFEGDLPALMVGFNRRFAPAMKVLKEQICDRRSPLQVHYRLNGGFIPGDSWIQDEQGGGRNIGEACHMYDVFRFLTGSPVSDVSAMSVNPQELPYQKNDNFSASIAYEDGSQCTLTYTALGPKAGMSKERIEVFCDGEAYLLDDFVRLERCSDREVLWQADQADKGQSKELELWAKCVAQGGDAPISFEEICETTAVSLFVEDQIQGRVLKG